jgi:hypothetical protein
MIPAVTEGCAGIDVGKKFLAVCVMTGPANENAKPEVRRFGTTRSELEKLRQWLQAEGCTHAVMESTGVYWKPVLNILEDDPEYPLQIVLAQDRPSRREIAGASAPARHDPAGFHPASFIPFLPFLRFVYNGRQYRIRCPPAAGLSKGTPITALERKFHVVSSPYLDLSPAYHAYYLHI